MRKVPIVMRRCALGPRSRLGVLALALAACGGGQTRGHPLESSWSDEDGTELEAFRSGWQRPAARPLPEVTVGLRDPDLLVGRSRSGTAWQVHHAFDSRPILAGELVLGLGAGDLIALDSATGEERWRRPAWGYLRGVADDGSTTVVTIETLTGGQSTVLAVDREGRVTRQIYERSVIGAPAVFDDFAFLPYGRRLVLVFDLVEGREVARVVSDVPVSRAFLVGDDLYFGETTALRFDEKVVEARRGGGHRITPPSRRFPGSPRWLLPGDFVFPVEATRHDSVRFFVRPAADGARAAWSALAFYRIVVGLGPDGRTRWVHTGSDTVLGGHAGADFLAVCDAGGHTTWLDAGSGLVLGRADLGMSLRTCDVSTASPPDGVLPSPRPLEDQLFAALRIADPLSLPVQLVLLEDLDGIEGDRAMAVLIDLARRRPLRYAAEGTLRESVVERLRRRKSGRQAVVDALRAWSASWRPYDTPIAALADNARRFRRGEVAEEIVRGLAHPFASITDLEAIAEAAAVLARREHATSLAAFVTRHRCAEAPPLQNAVARLRRTLDVLGHRDLLAVAGTCDRSGEGPSSGSPRGPSPGTAPP